VSAMRHPLLVAALALCACASSKQSVAPVLQSSPPAIAGTSIAIDPTQNVGGYWSHNKLGFELVRALAHRLELTLARAGYSISKTQRADLWIKLTAELSGSTKDLQSVTRMEVIHDGRVLERFEVKSPDDMPDLRAEHYPEYVATTLANRMIRSSTVLAISFEPKKKPPPSMLAELTEGAVVAVFDVIDASGQLDDKSQDQLSDYLSVRATQALGLRVVPRANLRELLQKKKEESYRACADETCQIELGKALSAEKTLAPKLIRMGGACAIAATLFDLKTETAELAASIKTKCAKEALLQGIDDLIDAMKKQSLARSQ
jgi:hypothetical protein